MYREIYKNLVFINLGIILLSAIKSAERYFAGDINFIQIDYFFLVQFILSLVLLVLVNKKLFIPSFIIGCVATVALAIFLYNKLLPVTEYYTFFTNELLLTLLTIVHWIAIAFITLFFYALIAGYPYRVLKRAKRFRLFKT